MDVVAVGGAAVIAQIALTGGIGLAFRRAWHRALHVPVRFPEGLPDVRASLGEAGPGFYQPDRRQALLDPALRDRRHLAALAVHLHEMGHHHQHLAQPLAVHLNWPLRTLATLTGALGALLIVGGLLRVNRGLADLGAVLCAGNVLAGLGLVLLEWDASRRGVAILTSTRAPVPTGLRPLLLLAALTYLGLAWSLLLPILQPEAACTLPLSDDGADLSRADRHSSPKTRRGNHGEQGTGGSEDQPGGAQGAVGRDETGHDRGRARPG